MANVNVCSVGVIGIKVIVLFPTLLAVSEIFHGKRKERHFRWEEWYG